MDISTALATDLAALTTALDEPGADLGSLLTSLSRTLRQAVPSCLGLSLTLVVDGCPVTLTTLGATTVATSMRISLTPLAPVGSGGVVTFYAARAGAFVDLAADADFALGAHLAVLDGDLEPTATDLGVGGVDELSLVNLAVGYLVGSGYTLVAAAAELDRRAHQAGSSRIDAARKVLGREGPS